VLESEADIKQIITLPIRSIPFIDIVLYIFQRSVAVIIQIQVDNTVIFTYNLVTCMVLMIGWLSEYNARA